MVNTKNTRFLTILAGYSFFPLLLLFVGIGLITLVSFKPSVNIHWHGHLDQAVAVGKVICVLAVNFFICAFLLAVSEMYQRRLNGNNYIATGIIKILKTLLRIIFVLAAINIIITMLTMDARLETILQNCIILMIIVSTAWSLIQIIHLVETIAYNQSLKAQDTALVRSRTGLYTKIHILKNLAMVIIIIVAIASSFMIFEKVRSVGVSILASAGVLTAIIALAAQKTLGSIFGGIQLIITQPFQIGDVITVENQIGIVEEISLTYVIVKLWNARRLVVPIQYFFDKTFINHSKSTDGYLTDVKLTVDKNIDLERVEASIRELLQTNPNWEAQGCQILVADVKDNKIDLLITFGSRSVQDLDKLASEIRKKFLSEFQFSRE